MSQKRADFELFETSVRVNKILKTLNDWRVLRNI